LETKVGGGGGKKKRRNRGRRLTGEGGKERRGRLDNDGQRGNQDLSQMKSSQEERKKRGAGSQIIKRKF